MVATGTVGGKAFAGYIGGSDVFVEAFKGAAGFLVAVEDCER